VHAALAVGLFVLASAACGQSQPRRSFEAIAPLVEGEIAAGNIPGAVVVIGNRDGILYHRAFGYRSVEPERTPMTEATLFDLASLTKVIATTMAVMQLAEEGRLSLDQRVAALWPRFGSSGKAAITVRELLTHESGLRPGFDPVRLAPGYAAAVQQLVDEHVSTIPGTRYRYSDLNFLVLGELVRRVSGLSLDEYVRRNVFAPLGMKDTSFLLSRTQRERAAPTEMRSGRWLSGEVHDPIASRIGGVAGHAGLFSTAHDLAIFARMLLHEGSVGGATILRPETVRTMTSEASHADPVVRRGLGWELADDDPSSDLARLGPRAYGHTGFTGTSLWIEPDAGVFVVLLTSRLHPHGTGTVKPLRTRLAQEVAAIFSSYPVATGLDVLEGERFAPLAGLRVGLITNHTGRDRFGRRTIDLLQRARDVRLAALFAPEHGIDGAADSAVDATTDRATGLRVYSLYGANLRPTDAMLDGLDALVFDIQDAGTRFYTYITTMAYAMEAAARRGIAFYVLDRPNPIDATTVQGPVMDEALRSFTGYFPLPIRHGMTVGELAALFNGERRIGADLHVIGMHGYRRTAWYDDTRLPWIAPSPNLRTLAETALYPGVALLEGANLSVGRGTPTPFELVGAPWIDAELLTARLRERHIAGVQFHSAHFTPTSDVFAGEACHGVRITLADRDALDAPELGVEIAAAIWSLHPAQFRIERTLGMLGSRAVLAELRSGSDPLGIRSGWQPAIDRFAAVRARYLRYDATAFQATSH